MRLGIVALLLTACLLPTAAAQVPSPDETVALVCDTVDGIDPPARLPFCAQEDPAGPAPATADDESPPAPPAPPARDVAERVEDAAEAAPTDPAGTPDRVMDIALLVVEKLRELLSLPAVGAEAIEDAAATLRGAVADAKSGAADAVIEAGAGVQAATRAAFDAVSALFGSFAPDTHEAPRERTPAGISTDVAVDLRLPLPDLGL